MKFHTSQIKGHGRGKLLGFPTLNLEIPSNFDITHGIYAALVWLGGKKYKSALHFGPIPTFNHSEVSLEIFILDCHVDDDSIQDLEFEVGQFLRPVRNFSSIDELKNQIHQDVTRIRDILKD